MEAIFLVCGAGGPQLKRNPLGGHITDNERSRTFGRALLVSLTAIAFVVAPAFLLHEWLGLDLRRGGAISLGVIYLAAAARLPWPGSRAYRNLNVFALIDDERSVRLLMGVVGTGLIVMAILWHPS